jgi:hypothetical protein
VNVRDRVPGNRVGPVTCVSSPVRYFDGWLDGLTMLRYDSAVYTLPAVSSDTKRNPFHAADDVFRIRS